MVVALSLAACSKWTDTESLYEPDSLPIGEGRNEKYYENLRRFKASMRDRKISWCWYGGWTGLGADMYHSLAGLPDSVDIVGMWGTWDYSGLQTEDARRRDLAYVQQVKGTKVVATDLIGNFDEKKIREFGWDGELDPRGEKNSIGLFTAPLTAVQEEAIRKYARWTKDQVLALGYDGYDIDYEIGYGSKGTLVEYLERMKVFVDELSKFMGPKSGTDKLLIMDGAIANIPTPEMGLCFDWLVIQAYRCTSYTNLNTGGNRLRPAVDRMKSAMPIQDIIEKIVMTEDYEGGRGAMGGVDHQSEFEGKINSLLGMAIWQPVYEGVRYPRSGGAGTYHIEYEYTALHPRKVTGFYPYTREAIQAMNPANIK